jgi:hypothetical protein
LKLHLPLAILFHLIKLVLHNDGLINHSLEILIVNIKYLELDFNIEPIQECILFLFISVDIIWSISWQLSKSVEILLHSHATLLQILDFFLLKLQGTTGYIISSESCLELIPCDSTNVLVRVVLRLPPIDNCSK